MKLYIKIKNKHKQSVIDVHVSESVITIMGEPKKRIERLDDTYYRITNTDIAFRGWDDKNHKFIGDMLDYPGDKYAKFVDAHKERKGHKKTEPTYEDFIVDEENFNDIEVYSMAELQDDLKDVKEALERYEKLVDNLMIRVNKLEVQ